MADTLAKVFAGCQTFMATCRIVTSSAMRHDGLSARTYHTCPGLRRGEGVEAVSYTHLTLPTICSV